MQSLYAVSITLSDCNQNWNMIANLNKSTQFQNKLQENSIGSSQVVTHGCMDTDMVKL
jgi:hypothetical protein